PTAVRIRKPSQNVGTAASPNVGSVSIEHAIIMCLPVFGEGLDDCRIRLHPICLKGTKHHPQSAVGHNGALKRGVGLKTHDYFVSAIDVTGRVGSDRAWYL